MRIAFAPFWSSLINPYLNWSDHSGHGRVRWLVELVSGAYKEVSEKIARNYARSGRNIEAIGSDAERQGRKMAKDAYGDVKHDAPHPDVPANLKGHHEPHFQPERRPPSGHIFHRTFGAVATAALANALKSAGDAVGTKEDTLNANSSDSDRLKAKLWDMVDPASDVADGLRAAGKLLGADPEQTKQCLPVDSIRNFGHAPSGSC